MTSKFCHHCGNALQVEHRFCYKCGTEVISGADAGIGIGYTKSKKISQRQFVVIVILFLGCLSLLTAFGWNAFQSNQRGFALSGAAGKDAQPSTVTSMSTSPTPENVLDQATLKQVQSLQSSFSSETKRAKKKDTALLLANLFINARWFDSAAVYFEKAALVSAEKSEMEIYSLKAANIFHDIRNLPEAIRLYSSILMLNPNNTDARVDYALTLIENGVMMQGVTEMKKAVEMSPNHQKANLNLGILYAQINKLTEAKTLWEKAYSLNPASDAGKMAKDLIQGRPK